MKEVFLVNCDTGNGLFNYSIGFHSEEEAEKCKKYINSKKSSICSLTEIRRHFIFDTFDLFLEKLEKCNASFLTQF